MFDVFAFLFWFSVGTIVYSYAGFFLVLVLAGWLRNRRVNKQPVTPLASLIIAAYNEEKSIAKKIENSLELDYPPGLLEIIVTSDGSGDRTAEIVREYAGRGVKLLDCPRRGKIFALKDAVAHARGEILVFSDANTLYHPQAIRKLAQNFADPQVGGVCGNQLHIKHLEREKQDNVSQGEMLYWGYDKWLKKIETLTGSIVAADGAIYAIRRELFRMPPVTAVTDDFAISTAVVEQGYRLVFDAEALAYEKPMAKAEQEFNRKVRIMNRGLRGVLMRKQLLNPFRYGFYSLTLFSHKVLRRLVPFFLILLFISSAFLSGQNLFYLTAFAAQAGFYALAGLSYLLRKTALGRWKIFYIPFFYCLANAAAMVAILNLLRGKQVVLWNPERQGANL
ncbi:MAG: glycosyltransferase family 2 protein [Calditrichaceae bacterium]|nr:glycosyltransferase family 2 protein [Calditrichia bacterium]NUQ41334.1 glycosyltransferase family 2 protein [Calditrichaceae bacterium]